MKKARFEFESIKVIGECKIVENGSRLFDKAVFGWLYGCAEDRKNYECPSVDKGLLRVMLRVSEIRSWIFGPFKGNTVAFAIIIFDGVIVDGFFHGGLDGIQRRVKGLGCIEESPVLKMKSALVVQHNGRCVGRVFHGGCVVMRCAMFLHR